MAIATQLCSIFVNMQKLSSGIYKNEFVTFFEGDDSGNVQPGETPGMLYSKTIPTPVKKPALIAWSAELAKQLGIAQPDEEDISILGGNRVTASMYPYAACYGGHQFGNWAGQLGDGRAITLGEWETAGGKTWELQLKGAGPTAYSRRGDGRAVLRSSVREYLMSEAMFHLGVPTTRALSLVSTGDQVMRDMFYDGRPAYEPGAIVMRAAPSFLRFGNFEMLAARKDLANLNALVNWTIDRYYPHLQGEDRIYNWFAEIVERTATMIVEWLRVGFVHGVMNTDNMSVLGLTIDYGPFSFMDNYDPDFTPNTTDLPGRRYAFGKQASVAYWNLGCLANAIAPLTPQINRLVEKVEAYEDIFWSKYYSMMGNKLGLDQVKQDDINLIAELEKTLILLQPDMTIFYQLVMDMPLSIRTEQEIITHFTTCFYSEPDDAQRQALHSFIIKYQERIGVNACSRHESAAIMKRSNPRFILRNYLLHQAIEELERGNNELFLQLHEAIKYPYADTFDQFFKTRPAWANEMAGCSMLSCSS